MTCCALLLKRKWCFLAALQTCHRDPLKRPQDINQEAVIRASGHWEKFSSLPLPSPRVGEPRCPVVGWVRTGAHTTASVCGEVWLGDASLSPSLLAQPGQVWKEKLIVI